MAGCQSPRGQDRGSLALSVENTDTETHTVWVHIRTDAEEPVDQLDMVSVPAGSSFQFEGETYRRQQYSIRIDVDRSQSLTYEWSRDSCEQFLQLVVTIDTGGRPQLDADCL